MNTTHYIGCSLLFLLLFLLLTLSACSEALLHDLDEVEAVKLAAIMEKHDIPVEIDLDASGEQSSTSRWSLLVSSQDLSSARALLSAYRLPKASIPKQNSAGLLGPSPDQRHRQSVREQALQLEKTLRQFTGVIDARVHLALPERNPWPSRVEQHKTDSTASILLLLREEASVDDVEVQRLVSGGVRGLKPSSVSVLVQRVDLNQVETPSLVPLGPWSVAESSRLSLQLLLAGLVFLLVVLGATLLRISWRVRRNVDS